MSGREWFGQMSAADEVDAVRSARLLVERYNRVEILVDDGEWAVRYADPARKYGAPANAAIFGFDAVLGHMDREIANAKERRQTPDLPDRTLHFYRGLQFGLERARLRMRRAMGLPLFGEEAS